MAASEVEPSWHLATEMAQVVSRSQGTRALDELFSEVLNVVSWKWYNVAMARLHSHICELDMPMALRAAHETLAHGLCIEPSLVQRLVDTLHRKGIHIPLVKLLLCLIERAPAQEVPITCKMRGLGSCTSCQNFEAYLVIAKTMPSDRLLKASNLSITSMLSKLLNRGAVKEAQQVAELIPISGQYADGILMTMKARAHAAYGWSTTALQALRVAQEVFRMRIDSRVALSIARSVVLYDDFDSAVTIALMGNGMDRPHVQPLVKAIFAAGSALFKHVPTALRSFKPLNHPEWKSKSRTTHSDKRFANTPLVPPQSDVLGTQGLLEAAIDVPDHAKDVARRVIREQLPALLENATSTMLMDRVTLDQDTVNLAASFAYLFDALRKVGMLEEAVELLRLLSAPEYGNATFIDSYASNCVLRSAAVRENHFDLLNTLELLREIGAPINAYGAGTALAYCARCRGGVGRAMQMLDLLTMWNETAVLSPLTYVPAARLAYLEGFESLKQITEFLLRTVDKKILVREGEGSGMTRRDMQIGLVLQSAYTACRTVGTVFACCSTVHLCYVLCDAVFGQAEEIVQLQRIALRKFSWNPTFEATNYGVDKIRMLSAPSSWVEVHQLLEDARSVRPELLNRLFLFNQTTAMAMLQCYSNSHNPEVALEALDKAIEVYPNQQQGTFAEGILLCKNNFDKVRTAYMLRNSLQLTYSTLQALHLFQHIRTTRRFPCLNSYSNIVLVAKCTKRYHEMFAFFEEMLEKKGHVTAQSAHAISEFFKERNHTDGAVRYWIRLWSLFPQSRSQVIVRELLTAHAANHDWTRLKTKLVEISQYGMLTLSGRDIRVRSLHLFKSRASLKPSIAGYLDILHG
jgi:tetratricopeptide (TPR) repeat protein